jgi:hypothetical protein
MTAYGGPDLDEQARKRGVYRVIGKPFDMHGLAELVSQADRANVAGRH